MDEKEIFDDDMLDSLNDFNTDESSYLRKTERATADNAMKKQRLEEPPDNRRRNAQRPQRPPLEPAYYQEPPRGNSILPVVIAICATLVIVAGMVMFVLSNTLKSKDEETVATNIEVSEEKEGNTENAEQESLDIDSGTEAMATADEAIAAQELAKQNELAKRAQEDEMKKQSAAAANSSTAGFIFPDSNTRYLTRSDLDSLSPSSLELARNEIYARHGYPFQRTDLQQYFANFSWYQRDDSFSEGRLNAVEKANVAYIKQVEDGYTGKPSTGTASNGTGTVAPSNNAGSSEYILPSSSSVYLKKSDISWLSKSMLPYARNEIYARHGYIFNNQDYKNYFGSCSWYRPNSNFSESMLSAVEKANIELIKSME